MTNATDFTALAEAVRGRVDELQRLCDAATPGVWEPGQYTTSDRDTFFAPNTLHTCVGADFDKREDGKFDIICSTGPGGHGPSERDALFIAAARTALPALLTYARGLLSRYSEAEAGEAAALAHFNDPPAGKHDIGTLYSCAVRQCATLRTELAELAALLEVGI